MNRDEAITWLIEHGMTVRNANAMATAAVGRGSSVYLPLDLCVTHDGGTFNVYEKWAARTQDTAPPVLPPELEDAALAYAASALRTSAADTGSPLRAEQLRYAARELDSMRDGAS